MFAGMLLAATLAAAPPVLPPTPRFRTYGVAAGLPSSRVYITAQDRLGYLWIGAGDGLARFDGQGFRVWRHRADEPGSIGGNDVSALLVDRDGNVWAGGEGSGLNRYDPASDGFRHWYHGADAASLAGNDLTSVVQDAGGAIWVGMYGAGVDRLRADESGFEHLRHVDGDADSLVSDNVLTLLGDSRGRLWIGTDSGLDVRAADGRLQHVRFEGEQQPLYVWQVVEDGARARVATDAGLFFVDTDGVARRWPAVSPRHTVFASLRMPDGELWVAARGALRLYGRDGAMTEFRLQPLLAGGLHGRMPFGLTRDREGGLWIATTDAGLAYLGPDWHAFSRFGHVPEDPDSLAFGRIMALARLADGRLLAGGQGILDRFDPVGGAVEHLAGRVQLGSNSVVALAVHGERLWIGTERDLRLVEHGRVRKVDDPRLRSGSRQLLFDTDGSLLAASYSEGIVRIDTGTLAVTPVPSTEQGAGAGETHQLTRAHGRVWRASSAGLTWLSRDGRRFEPVTGVAPGWVHAFALRGDTLWLARTDMLESYRVDDGRVERTGVVDVASGWPGVDINSMTIDARGRVWMASRTGLWCHDPASGSFRRFSVEDGLPSPEFTDALVALPDGIVYAGTGDGVVGFHADATFALPPPPQLLLDDVAVRRDGALVVLPHDAAAVDLRWDDRDLSVTAQALGFVAPAHLRYRFRMDGFDSGWVDTGGNGTREFTGLGPGRYDLRIEAAGAVGAWTALPPLEVRVAAPPWRQPWAWALYALALLLLGWSAWRLARWRVERRVQLGLLEQKRQLAEQASAAKTRFLATLGHEIRTPMTGVLGMAELLDHTTLDARQRGMVETIERSGAVLLKLVNDALDLARIEAGRLDLESVPLDPSALLHEVIALETGLAQSKGLALRAEVAPGVPPRVLGDAVRIRQILLNLISNALKFSEQGEVRVALAMHEGALRYSVSDNGPGLTESVRKRLFRRFEQGDSGSHSGSGLGLAICRELATLMGGRVEVESEPGHGSTFHALLPLPTASDGVAPAAEPARPVARRRLLVVEDDATVAAVIVGLLRAQGHDVRHAADALAALAEFEVAPCDAILVDLDLPGVDGFRLIDMLRARPGGDAVAVVVVTARTARDDEDRAQAAGADAFLRKPVNGARLAGALAEAEHRRGTIP